MSGSPTVEVTEHRYTTSFDNNQSGGQNANNFNQQNVSYRINSSNYSQANPQANTQVVHKQNQQINNFPAQSNQAPQVQVMTKTTTTTTSNKTSNILNDCIKNNAANLAAELAQKEAKLMAEINALHQRPYTPYATPAKIDLTTEGRKLQQQQEHAPSPRPQSRATSADFLDKEAKLLHEIDEIERKPFNPQTMVVEREQWFEHPQGRPYERQLTDSKRRIRDFCSLPSYMYEGQDRHIHEDNLPLTAAGGRPSSSAAASSIHTTIIRSPRREVDNKSPLPFAFDNFTTKGVRGNIASVGAIEPDRPRPPIYPIVKRSPTPNMAHG